MRDGYAYATLIAMQWARKQTGFTIVELLIVVVVIAILAAITIVAYNGIQNRAKSSALQSSASQAEKKLLLAAVDSGDLYPVDKAAYLLATNQADTPSETYDYFASNDQKSYCVSVTGADGASQARTKSAAGPLEGRCVQNAVLNPSIEINSANMTTAFGQGGVTSMSVNGTAPLSGASVLRTTWTTAPTSVTTGGLWSGANSSTGLNAGGKTYVASGYVRNSWAGGIFNLNLVGRTSGGAVTSEVYGPNVTVPSGAWTRVSVSWTAPANTDYFEVRIRQSGGSLPVVGSTLDVDGFLLTEGVNLYSYGGSETTGWSARVSGVNSISFGPAVRQ